MADVSIFLVLILLVDFVISIWNSYASGYNITMVRNNPGAASTLTKASSYAGLGLGFVGIAYVLTIVLSLVGVALNWIGADTLNFALGFSFIVFGALIIGLGIIVTIQSIVIAVERRDFWSILIAIWNTFAIIFDVAVYASGFEQGIKMIGGSKSKTSGIMVVLVAALIAFFITWAAYKHGCEAAKETSVTKKGDWATA